jgi:hypothetical protein
MFVVITGLHCLTHVYKSVLNNIRSQRPRLAGHIGTLVKQEMHIKFGRRNFKEEYYLEDLDVDGRC